MRFFNSSTQRGAVEATNFLRQNSRLAALLPAAQRMAELQHACAEALPMAFKFCEILAYSGEEMTLSVPNAAVAAKLKQQLPKLQEGLLKRGWQISNIRLKVQMMKTSEVPPPAPVGFRLSEAAVESFAELSQTLEPTTQNAALIAALQGLVSRRR